MHLPHRDAALEHAGVIGALEVIVLKIAEIGEGDLDHLVRLASKDIGEAQPGGIAAPVIFLQVPLAFLAPAQTRAQPQLGWASSGERWCRTGLLLGVAVSLSTKTPNQYTQ